MSKHRIFLRDSIEVKPALCPACGKILNRVMPMSKKRLMPEKLQVNPGDITGCGGCGTLLTFGKDDRLYRASSFEIEEHRRQEPDLVQALEFLQIMVRENSPFAEKTSNRVN